MIDLIGKTPIVTGSSGGIGFAIVQGLLAAGATVVLDGRTQDRVDAALAKLGSGPSRERARGRSLACPAVSPSGWPERT